MTPWQEWSMRTSGRGGQYHYSGSAGQTVCCWNEGALATFSHQHKGALVLNPPISTYVGMCKVVIAYRFYEDDIDQITKSIFVHDVR